MKVDELVKHFLLENPTVYINKFGVLDDVFFEGGYGLHWRDGEICFPSNCLLEKYTPKSSLLEVIFSCMENVSRLDLKNYIVPGGEEKWREIIEFHQGELTTAVKIVLDLDTYSKDMTLGLIDKHSEGKGWKQTFYDISSDALICNLPSDITLDWLEAADEFIRVVEDNMDRVDPRTSREEFTEVIRRVRVRITELKMKNNGENNFNLC